MNRAAGDARLAAVKGGVGPPPINPAAVDWFQARYVVGSFGWPR